MPWKFLLVIFGSLIAVHFIPVAQALRYKYAITYLEGNPQYNNHYQQPHEIDSRFSFDAASAAINNNIAEKSHTRCPCHKSAREQGGSGSSNPNYPTINVSNEPQTTTSYTASLYTQYTNPPASQNEQSQVSGAQPITRQTTHYNSQRSANKNAKVGDPQQVYDPQNIQQTQDASQTLVLSNRPNIRAAAASSVPVQIKPNIVRTVPTTGNRNPHEKFNTKLFSVIGSTHPYTNVIYSPISLQTLLAFVYTGSRGYTAEELSNALQLPDDKKAVAYTFEQLMSAQQDVNGPRLVMASKIYFNQNLRMKEPIRNFAKTYFGAELEPMQFSVPMQAADIINYWVAKKTDNRISNMVSASTLDENTQAVLVNAIYFKARWENEFSTSDTTRQKFHMSKEQIVPVDMMYSDDVYRCGEFDDIQARVIELPYNNSDMSMMIILPYALNGLPAVEEHLKKIDLAQLSEKLKPTATVLRLPKFRVEFELEMIEPLRMIGINRLFTQDAELQDFFEDGRRVGISKVAHKANINVNEAGSEAAAASFLKIIPLSLPSKIIYFTADHPFVFAIRSPRAVYFMGHVVKF